MTDVVLTHLHMDHCGGLLADGMKERLRPDLRIHVAAAEAEFWEAPDFSRVVMPPGFPDALRRTGKRFLRKLSSTPDSSPGRCGILIYTATAGAQGTLGGLVGTASRFARILGSALARVTICSNDPVCADHEPDDRSGDRATHGAACHGCLLIAETSCEMRNLFLDRNLLVPMMAADGSAFFQVG